MERWTMTRREIDRLCVINAVIGGKATWRQAGAQLNISERQVGRLCASVKAKGPHGIIHGLRGRHSNHRLDESQINEALGIVRTRYAGFGPTLACEKLRENEKKTVSISALRGRMIAEGLWQPCRHRKRRRAWRERKASYGIMVQLDGSHHAWFEERGAKCALLLYIDDATSSIPYAEFAVSESTECLMRATWRYLELHGRPVSYYVDRDSIYKINRQASIEEELKDEPGMTQFDRALRELGIGLIFAHSPQAKGRVERSFRTHQDRLVKELRLAGISTIEEANRYLREVYLPRHNERFAVKAADSADAHRPLMKCHRLEEIFSSRSERVVLNDHTLRYKNRYYQLEKRQPVRVGRGERVTVEKRLDGTTHVLHKEEYLGFREIPKPTVKPAWASPAVKRASNPFSSGKPFIARVCEKRGQRRSTYLEEPEELAPAFV